MARLSIQVLSVFCALFLRGSCSAAEEGPFSTKAIFGNDDRQELFSTASRWRELGRSIAGKVSMDHIRNSGSNWELQGEPLSKKECPGNRYADQITVPSCTGFLAKPNILVTAAHCVKSQDDCDRFYWVFEYALSQAGDKGYAKVGGDRVFRCKRIVSKKYQNFGDVDYALLELDRAVAGRNPLRLGFDLRLSVGQPVVNIGNSNGLPLKFKDSAKIIGMKDNQQSFDSDLDTFGGDSGSPVFDAETGVVIGIQSTAHADHYHDDVRNCRQLKICRPGDKCHPATSSRISNLENEPALALAQRRDPSIPGAVDPEQAAAGSLLLLLRTGGSALSFDSAR